ncbi:SpaH/EbpB family LPXTG-anchored major pilin [Enterococcus mediterraneensis]|uniref:SpaH/EbpB family LPXTG-anchored major pilin n=1 Tax=Enterococcus mediterraneensis TaxID=2364791 RepID=UPI000F04C708|nr:SpaH/EbpB family LPXTG-anchored major pilin [Enterococcus mediterraneensis]
MKKGRKIWGIFASVLMMLPLLLGAFSMGNVAFAEDSEGATVNVELRKKQFEEVPELRPNIGLEMDYFEDFDGLKGAVFKVVDATEEYYDYLADNPNATVADAQKALAADPDLEAKAPLHEGVTDADGILIFEGLPATATYEERTVDAVYMFVETDSPTQVSARAANLVLVLPVYATVEDEETELEHIILYPKNEITEGFDKGIVGEDGNIIDESKLEGALPFEIGQEITYAIQFRVPNNIGQTYTDAEGVKTSYQAFGIRDVADPELTFVGIKSITNASGNVTLVEDKGEGGHYTVSPATGGNGFSLDFNLSATAGDLTSQATATALKAYAGQTLTITYTMYLNDTAEPDFFYDNDGYINVNHRGTPYQDTDDAPPVTTGGRRFLKQNAATSAALPGAKFVIGRGTASALNNDTDRTREYAFFTDDGKIEWGELEKATVFTSGSDGAFAVEGMTYSSELGTGMTYFAEETEAPAGFRIITQRTPFEVNLYSYYADPTELTPADPLAIGNRPEGGLPSTGGNGIYAFLMIGAGLMVGAYLWYKKSKEQAEV